MTRFDRDIMRAAKNFTVPESYEKRVEETIQSLPGELAAFPCEFPKRKYKRILAFVCVCLICAALFSTVEVTQAGFLEMFKETIFDFLGIDTEKSQQMGIESRKENTVSKPDLMLELQEKVIDSQNIYLVVKVTAPANVVFGEEIGFDYFAFAEGSNYNTEQLISGARDCRLLEVLEGRDNVATYIVSLSTVQELQEGTEVTAFFKDLTVDPNGEQPEVLVEGMWSVTFLFEPSVFDEIEINGTPDATYPFLGTTARLEKLNLTPLGLTLVSDISEADYEMLGFADTTIAIRLKMTDNSELVVTSHDEEDTLIISSGSNSFSEEEEKIRMTFGCQFETPIAVTQVSGVYLEDYYLPVTSEVQ